MRLAEGLFITGTDTGVGKTVTTAALAAALAESGARVRALKPVQSGEDDDAAFIAAAAGHAPKVWKHFQTPVSPHRAAAIEGETLTLQAIRDWIDAEAGAPTLVEGAGGWNVPYSTEFRVADLAASLGWPVLVVAANRLGVLNHTLLTVEAIRARSVPVAGIVLVESGMDASVGSNAEDLRALLPDVALRVLPRLSGFDRPRLIAAGRGLLLGG